MSFLQMYKPPNKNTHTQTLQGGRNVARKSALFSFFRANVDALSHSFSLIYLWSFYFSLSCPFSTAGRLSPLHFSFIVASFLEHILYSAYKFSIYGCGQDEIFIFHLNLAAATYLLIRKISKCHVLCVFRI